MASSKYDDLKLSNQLCFPLYAASRETIRLYTPLLDKIGLTYTQYLAMLVLWEEKSVNVKRLGKRLFLDSGTLTPVLKTLEAKGLITRSRSKEDERVLSVNLTQKGENLKDEALSIPNALKECVKLDPEESLQLYNLLYKLLASSKEEK